MKVKPILDSIRRGLTAAIVNIIYAFSIEKFCTLLG